ncbi:MAG: phosphate acyltransferase PlsX [Alphaproteobacteria bacterium]|nr:phosphate acyltransferase PlsX [Alphaproteobacteria bacterium]
MTRELTVSIDAMGGDAGPGVVISALVRTLERQPGTHFLLHGDEAALTPLLGKFPKLKKRVTVRHAPERVTMDDKPSQIARRGQNTSMWRAVASVKKGEADVAVSAGNTGALMAMSLLQLRTIEGISRPAIASIWPTMKGRTVVLDVGANVTATAEQLVDFAVMGEAFAHAMLGLERPIVGLLNVGSEEMKGNDAVKGAAQILRAAKLPIAFHGFVEGNDITQGVVDVVVTDGFTGNIALKTAEGAAKLIAQYLKQALRRSLLGTIGGFFARGALNTLKRNIDPRAAAGGIFLGLGGIVVKAHGGTDAIGFAGALDMAIDMARADINARITTDRSAITPDMEQAALT